MTVRIYYGISDGSNPEIGAGSERSTIETTLSSTLATEVQNYVNSRLGAGEHITYIAYKLI